MTNVSIHSPEAALALLVAYAKNFVNEGLDKVLGLYPEDCTEVLKVAIQLLQEERSAIVNSRDQREAYSVLIDLLREHLTNREP